MFFEAATRQLPLCYETKCEEHGTSLQLENSIITFSLWLWLKLVEPEMLMAKMIQAPLAVVDNTELRIQLFFLEEGMIK